MEKSQVAFLAFLFLVAVGYCALLKYQCGHGPGLTDAQFYEYQRNASHGLVQAK